MSVDAIQKELESLTAEDQETVFSFLAQLRKRREEERKERLFEILDTDTPGFWVPLDEVERRLAEKDAEEAALQ